MITLAELQAFSRYMDREFLHPDIAPVVRWAEFQTAWMEQVKAAWERQDDAFPMDKDAMRKVWEACR